MIKQDVTDYLRQSIHINLIDPRIMFIDLLKAGYRPILPSTPETWVECVGRLRHITNEYRKENGHGRAIE